MKAHSKKELPSIAHKLALYTAHGNAPHGYILIANDAAPYFHIPTSTREFLIAGFKHTIVPSHFSWPVTGLPVDLYVSGQSGVVERRLITELLAYGASEITLFQIERGQLLSPLVYNQKQGFGA